MKKRYIMIPIVMLAILAAFSMPAIADPCICDVETNTYPCNHGMSGNVTNGTVHVEGDGPSTIGYRKYFMDFNVPSGDIKWARVYWHVWMPGNWTDATFCNAISCWENNQSICDPSEEGCTCEQDETDGFYGGGCGTTWVYWNVTDKVTTGYNNITIANDPNPDGRTMWVYLVVVVDDLTDYPKSMPTVVTNYWINPGYQDDPEIDTNTTTWFNGTANNTKNGTLWHLGLCSEVTQGGIWFNDEHVRNDIPYDMTEEEIPSGWIELDATQSMTWDNRNDPYFHPVMAIFMDNRQPGKDLVVTDIELPEVMRPNTDYTINATIKNKGNLNVVNQFNVSLYVNSSLHDKTSITGLNEGASTTVSFNQPVNLPYGCHEFKVIADADGEIGELNEGNNNRIKNYQTGNVIVVKKNSDFDDLVTEGFATKQDTIYYIQNLEIENCAGDSIFIENTDVPFVINSCTLQDCSASGVFLNNVTYGTINGSIIKNNTVYGVEIGLTTQQGAVNPEFINITNNTIIENKYGIELIGKNSTVRNNTIKDNTGYGIYVFGNYSNITYNDIKYNHDYAVKVFNSTGNWIYGNTFISNNIGYPSRTSQGWDNMNNHWNNTGNYWSDYTGVDESPDNGFGDTVYDIDGGTAKDHYPLCYRDLVISEVRVNWPTDCKIYYEVTNIGRRIVTSGHNTTLYVNGDEKPHDTVSVSLSAGETYTGYFNYDWSSTSTGDNIDVCADKTGIVVECDKGNNWLNDTWMCGDVDGDGGVRFDFGDYFAVM